MNLLVNLSKFKLLLNKEDRKYLNIILIYQFLGSLLEAFGIALILPLLSIFLNQENQFTNFYSNLFGLENSLDNIIFEYKRKFPLIDTNIGKWKQFI